MRRVLASDLTSFLRKMNDINTIELFLNLDKGKGECYGVLSEFELQLDSAIEHLSKNVSNSYHFRNLLW